MLAAIDRFIDDTSVRDFHEMVWLFFVTGFAVGVVIVFRMT